VRAYTTMLTPERVRLLLTNVAVALAIKVAAN
jgi:hypothetical protein